MLSRKKIQARFGVFLILLAPAISCGSDIFSGVGVGFQGTANCGTANQVPYVQIAGTLTCDSGLTYAGTGGPVTQTKTSLGVTPFDVLLQINTTPAAVGAQQISPAWNQQGNGWGTTAGTSQIVNYRQFLIPIQGTVPSSQEQFCFSNSGGSYACQMTLTSGGLLQTASIATTGAIVSGNNLTLGTSNFLIWTARSAIASPANGQLEITNATVTAPGIAASSGTDVPACYNATSFQLTFGNPCGSGVSNIAQIVPIGSAPTIANGAGAGTAPGVPTVTGANMDHVVTIITGTATTTNATIATVTFNGTLTAAPKACHIQPLNAAAVAQNVAVFTGTPSTTTYTFSSGATPATLSSTFIWGVHCE